MDSSIEIAKKELYNSPQDSVQHADYDDLDENDNTKDGEDELEEDFEEGQEYFFSPEAGKKRLESLPNGVYETLLSMDISTSFWCFMSCLQNRCEIQRAEMQKHDFELMWTHMVSRMCVEFSFQHFGRKPTHNNFSENFLTYLNTTNIVTLIQMFVDLAQQNGFQAMTKLKELQECSKDISNRILHDAEMRTKDTKKLYHDFVTLCLLCSGSGVQRRQRQQYTDRTRSYNDNNTRERPGYQRGVYHNKATGLNTSRPYSNKYNPDNREKSGGGGFKNYSQSSQQSQNQRSFATKRSDIDTNQKAMVNKFSGNSKPARSNSYTR